MKYVDVIIIGGGMVGLSLACSLQNSGMQVAVLEQSVPESLKKCASTTLRVSTINTASKKLFIDLDIWSTLTECRISCYHRVEVWEKDNFGYIIFDDKSFGYNHLGYIIENVIIHTVLWQKAQQCANIQIISPVQPQEVSFKKNEVIVTMQNGDTLSARLIVGADGFNSWLRKQASIPIAFWNYCHHALIATIRTSKPHGNIVRQVFHNNSILAFLPLNDPHLCSIVWSLEPDDAQQMLETNLAIFNKELCVAFDNCLGLCSLESERYILPITGCYARQFTAHRLVLIGDAAHTIHPLAGQGVNLGFMDAAKLAKELRLLYNDEKDIGQHFYLRRYERSRRYTTAIMLAVIQGFHEIFAGNHPAKKLLRNLGLRCVNTLSCMKHQLLQHAMGLNDF